MRQFALYIDDEVKGPFSEYEVQDMIHSGLLTAESLCAPAGSQDWEPLSNHFTFGSNLKLTRKTTDKPAQPTETEPSLPRLDHDVRRRLLMYGLADAAGVDQISPIQADMLIRETETRIRHQILTRRITTYASLGIGALSCWFSLVASPSALATLGSVAESVTQIDAKAAAQWETICRKARDFEVGLQAAQTATFGEPAGGAPASTLLLARLQVNEDSAYNFSANVSLNNDSLVGPLNKFGITLDTKVTIHLLPADLPDDIARKAKAQGETLQLVLSPMLDNTQFEPLREELLSKFPDAPEIPESSRLRTELAELRIAELGMAADKVLFRAREADTIAEGKGVKTAATANTRAYASWAPRLRDFANQINLLRDTIRINVDPDARRKVWSDFNLGPGAELGAWVLSRSARTMACDENGEIKLADTANLRPETLQRRALVSFRINEDTVFLRWDSPFLMLGEVSSIRIPNEALVARERYKVVSLIETGGKRHAYRADVGGRNLSSFRDSPKLHYLAIAREKDTDVVTVRVDEATFAATKRGDLIPMETLAKLTAYPTPADPVAPASLTLE